MDWIPAVTTTGFLGAALWLGRSLIAERLKNSVKHEFDVKLENLRAEIRAGETHLDAVRSTALAALASGQGALNQRRLVAVDDLWKATMAMRSGSAIVSIVEALRGDEIAKHLHDPAVKQFIEMLGVFGDGFTERVKANEASAARPFVTPMAWALYTAYSSIVVMAHLKFEAIKLGVPSSILKTADALELVKTALPDLSPILEAHGTAALPAVLPDIEERLVAELRASADGRDSDPEAVERAGKVARVAARQEADRAKEEADALTGAAAAPHA